MFSWKMLAAQGLFHYSSQGQALSPAVLMFIFIFFNVLFFKKLVFEREERRGLGRQIHRLAQPAWLSG